MKPRHSPQSKENKPAEKRKMIPRDEFVIKYGSIRRCWVCEMIWSMYDDENHSSLCPLNK